MHYNLQLGHPFWDERAYCRNLLDSPLLHLCLGPKTAKGLLRGIGVSLWAIQKTNRRSTHYRTQSCGVDLEIKSKEILIVRSKAVNPFPGSNYFRSPFEDARGFFCISGTYYKDAEEPRKTTLATQRAPASWWIIFTALVQKDNKQPQAFQYPFYLPSLHPCTLYVHIFGLAMLLLIFGHNCLTPGTHQWWLPGPRQNSICLRVQMAVAPRSWQSLARLGVEETAAGHDVWSWILADNPAASAQRRQQRGFSSEICRSYCMIAKINLCKLRTPNTKTNQEHETQVCIRDAILGYPRRHAWMKTLAHSLNNQLHCLYRSSKLGHRVTGSRLCDPGRKVCRNPKYL